MAVLSNDPVDGFKELPNEDFRVYLERTDRKLAELRAKADALPDGEYKGAILQFPVADGHALYIVQKIRPLTLQHLPYCDAYSIPFAHVKGIDIGDVKQQVEYHKKMKEIFSSRKAQSPT